MASIGSVWVDFALIISNPPSTITGWRLRSRFCEFHSLALVLLCNTRVFLLWRLLVYILKFPHLQLCCILCQFLYSADEGITGIWLTSAAKRLPQCFLAMSQICGISADRSIEYISVRMWWCDNPKLLYTNTPLNNIS